jgi:hypothetical protein
VAPSQYFANPYATLFLNEWVITVISRSMIRSGRAKQTLKKLFVTNWPATSRAPVRSASTYRHSSKNGDVTKADN